MRRASKKVTGENNDEKSKLTGQKYSAQICVFLPSLWQKLTGAFRMQGSCSYASSDWWHGAHVATGSQHSMAQSLFRNMEKKSGHNYIPLKPGLVLSFYDYFFSYRFFHFERGRSKGPHKYTTEYFTFVWQTDDWAAVRHNTAANHFRVRTCRNTGLKIIRYRCMLNRGLKLDRWVLNELVRSGQRTNAYSTLAGGW